MPWVVLADPEGNPFCIMEERPEYAASGRGPLLELCPDSAPKTAAKNRFHLDIRLEQGDVADAVRARVLALGGSVVSHDWGELPWQVVTDPSGNELCLLSAR